jgi:hypothetical protein
VNNYTSVLLITFGSGSNEYSNKTPADFDFSTAHQQRFEPFINDGMFGFVNAVPMHGDIWHGRVLDHTANDVNGYMFFVNVAHEHTEIFNLTIGNLCTGLSYELSAYLANVFTTVRSESAIKPNVLFQVLSPVIPGHILAQLSTGDIPEYENMTWAKYGLSFIAPSSSVVLFMVSIARGGGGNDLAIDDIELRVCPKPDFGSSS